MKRILSAALLIGISGGLITINSAQVVQSQPSEESKKDSNPLAKVLSRYVNDVQNLSKKYKNALIKLQEEKGYDPKIYALIVSADSSLGTVTSTLDDLNTKGGDIDDLLSTVKSQIKVIRKMKPKVPTSLPGKCIAYRQNQVTGVIETLAGKWTFTTYQNNQVKHYQFSPNTGWIDSGELAYPPSRTPGGQTETAYLENGKVICLTPFGK